MYFVRGRSTATALTADHAIFGVWNGHSTQRIRLMHFAMHSEAGGTAGDGFRFRRATARGTAGSTITPDIDNDSERSKAPPSGFVLDLGPYSVQPTLDTSELWPAFVTNTSTAGAAGGLHRIPGGLVIPPGTGLVCVQTKATAWPASQIVVCVREEG